MRTVIDTCVIVDALQSREPFCKEAQSIFLLCANRQFEGFLTAKAITDIYYLTHRETQSDPRRSDKALRVVRPAGHHGAGHPQGDLSGDFRF